jgi:excisionase family DNA binding protein
MWYYVVLCYIYNIRKFLGELMDFRIRQLKRALKPLREALESHHRSLEGLESALIEFEETFKEPEQRQERPQAQPGAGVGHLDLLYRRIQSGEIPSVKLGRNIKVRREDLEGYLEAQRYQPTSGLAI